MGFSAVEGTEGFYVRQVNGGQEKQGTDVLRTSAMIVMGPGV